MAVGVEYQRRRPRFDPGSPAMGTEAKKISDTYLVGDSCACSRPAVVVASWQKRGNLSVLDQKALCKVCVTEATQGQTPPEGCGSTTGRGSHGRRRAPLGGVPRRPSWRDCRSRWVRTGDDDDR